MSLLELAMEPCVLLNKSRVDDGIGGYYDVWSDGVTFNAAFSLDTSIEAQIAAKDESIGIYTVTTTRALRLDYHDVFRRLSNGKTYRVTRGSEDRETPPTSALDMRQVNVREWELTND